ncbi:MAG: glycosyl hydrolase, partial [Planctomycetes bacterium]|nr:glycosyl hydrolase [Planctomycetota bacterium]
VKEKGPLVASLVAESDAPGCNRLVREVRVTAGLDRVDLINLLDKKAVREKEGVHLGFAFNVKDGIMRMDTPFAVVRPEQDQIPGACKNWFTVQRWVDVSNADVGVTWATVDAPLVEVGGLTAYLIGGLAGSPLWLEHIEPSQTLYSWAMNNHWHTNYRADQDGPTTFRYALRPHGAFDAAAAQRFGIEQSQPLVAAPAAAGEPPAAPLRRVEPAGVLVTAFKPSRDGKAWIVRLFNTCDQPQTAALTWSAPAPAVIRLKGFEGDTGERVAGPIRMAPYEIVTLRAARP